MNYIKVHRSMSNTTNKRVVTQSNNLFESSGRFLSLIKSYIFYNSEAVGTHSCASSIFLHPAINWQSQLVKFQYVMHTLLHIQGPPNENKPRSIITKRMHNDHKTNVLRIFRKLNFALNNITLTQNAGMNEEKGAINQAVNHQFL